MNIKDEAVEAAIAAFHERREGHDQWAGPNSMRAALEAALPHLSQGAVIVKPLEWSCGPLGRHEATTPFGAETVHEVRFDGKGGKVAYAIWGEVEYRSVYEAKAAAQADYERRIISALASHEPAPTDTQEGSGEAGEVVAWVRQKGSFLYFDNMRLDPTSIPLVRQSDLTACQQEVERLRGHLAGYGKMDIDLKIAEDRIVDLKNVLKLARWYVEVYDTIGSNTEQIEALEAIESALGGQSNEA